MTNLNPSGPDYMCLEYSVDLLNNSSGYDVELVNIAPCRKYPQGHFVVGLKDSGWRLFDAVSDTEIKDIRVASIVKDAEIVDIDEVKGHLVPIVRVEDRFIEVSKEDLWI